MRTLIFILLQGGPPDPDWGDPDTLPVNQHVHWLALAGMLLGMFTIIRLSARMRQKKG